MIRFFCRDVNTGAAANVGGPVDVTFRSFTDPAAMERWLRYDGEPDYAKHYDRREVIGVELEEETP